MAGTIGITGANGFIGAHLMRSAVARGLRPVAFGAEPDVERADPECARLRPRYTFWTAIDELRAWYAATRSAGALI